MIAQKMDLTDMKTAAAAPAVLVTEFLSEVSVDRNTITATGHPVHGQPGKPTAVLGRARVGERCRFRILKKTSAAVCEEMRMGVVAKGKYLAMPAGQSWHCKKGNTTKDCAFFLCCYASTVSLRRGGTIVSNLKASSAEGSTLTVQLCRGDGLCVRFWLSEECAESAWSADNPCGYMELCKLPEEVAEDLSFAVQFHNHGDAVEVVHAAAVTPPPSPRCRCSGAPST